MPYIFRRLLMVIPTLIIVTFLVSGLIYLSPGDPATVLLGRSATPEAVERLRKELELDKPMLVRYGLWLSRAVRGDFGRSWQRNEKVTKMILDRAPASVELALFAVIIELIFVVPIGVGAAIKRGTALDTFFMAFALVWISVPSFWLAIVMMFFFAVKLHLLPISGRGGPIWTYEGLRHIVLPAFAVGLRQLAVLTRMTRAQMLEVLKENYVTTARSKGLRETTVLFRHAFRNALLPVLTLFGLNIPALFSSTVIIENVFAWPGMGKLLVDAAFKRDFPLVQGIVVFYTLLVLLINLAVDIIYAYVDPRIRYE